MTSGASFERLCRDIYSYYGSQAVPADGDRTALMLRATGEPWTSAEIARHSLSGAGAIGYYEFERLVRSKLPVTSAGSDKEGGRQALVDDYGNVINLSVDECKEIVEAFKAIVQLRATVGEGCHEGVPIEYLRRVLTSMGDSVPAHQMKLLLEQLPACHEVITLRTLLKLLSRKQ